jgi:hypothetical protein
MKLLMFFVKHFVRWLNLVSIRSVGRGAIVDAANPSSRS